MSFPDLSSPVASLPTRCSALEIKSLRWFVQNYLQVRNLHLHNEVLHQALQSLPEVSQGPTSALLNGYMRSRFGSFSITTPVLGLFGLLAGLNTWYIRKMQSNNDTKAKALIGRAIAIVELSCSFKPRSRSLRQEITFFNGSWLVPLTDAEYAGLRQTVPKCSALLRVSQISSTNIKV
jgi:hypothetical protein